MAIPPAGRGLCPLRTTISCPRACERLLIIYENSRSRHCLLASEDDWRVTGRSSNMRFSTIITASALLLSGANAQEYYCWGHWDWGHRPGCGNWQGHQWYPYWFNQITGAAAEITELGSLGILLSSTLPPWKFESRQIVFSIWSLFCS
ncbi:hypothetical protein BDV11DRAFT_9771 [Aspergillus similis]